MPRTCEDQITAMRVEHLDARTIVVEVFTDLSLNALWPYVRANHAVPDQIRRNNAVFSVRDPESADAAELPRARQLVLDDVVWREDPGYVGAARFDGGWVFAWSGGAR